MTPSKFNTVAKEAVADAQSSNVIDNGKNAVVSSTIEPNNDPHPIVQNRNMRLDQGKVHSIDGESSHNPAQISPRDSQGSQGKWEIQDSSRRR
jgi:hypothetical protein